jgi:hypothetical protein
MNNIDKSREMLRELQSMLFKEIFDRDSIFSKTLEIDEILNNASIDYNKYINDKEN